VATVKVVDMDGSMAQYAAPITAREALGDDERRRGAPVFLCSSDELRLDAPPRALADEEALQPGWLYLVLPMSMLPLTLTGHEMAALALQEIRSIATNFIATTTFRCSKTQYCHHFHVCGNRPHILPPFIFVVLITCSVAI
jgi:hypothetical protein